MKTIVVGPAWSALAKTIAHVHELAFVPLTVKQFADTETCISLEQDNAIAGAHIVLVYQLLRIRSFGSTSSPRTDKNSVCPEPVEGCKRGCSLSINDQTIGLLQAVDALKVLGAKSISLFLPYLTYGRQDVSVDKQHPGAVFMLGRCLAALGVTQVVVCDMHAPAIIPSFSLPLHNIEMVLFWARVIADNVLKKIDAKNVCIVSPDHGGRQRAEAIALQLGTSFAFVRKIRVAQDAALGYELVGDVAGKVTIIVDDIIDTARTAVSASELLKTNGAKVVYGCFTHAVFSEQSYEQLKKGCFEYVFVTDTLGGMPLEDAKIQYLSINDYVCAQSNVWLRK